MIKDLTGKVAVITGAGSGIGRSLAHGFAKKGMKLVLSDINPDTLDKVKVELEKPGQNYLNTSLPQFLEVLRIVNLFIWFRMDFYTIYPFMHFMQRTNA